MGGDKLGMTSRKTWPAAGYHSVDISGFDAADSTNEEGDHAYLKYRQVNSERTCPHSAGKIRSGRRIGRAFSSLHLLSRSRCSPISANRQTRSMPFRIAGSPMAGFAW
jgi:hypothetical protein